MTKKKDEKPARLRWFCLDSDSFFEDSRMQSLTTREKSFWLMMITKSFRHSGIIPCDTDIICDNTGATEKEANKLLTKLTSSGLLVYGNKHDPLSGGSMRWLYSVRSDTCKDYQNSNLQNC